MKIREEIMITSESYSCFDLEALQQVSEPEYTDDQIAYLAMADIVWAEEKRARDRINKTRTKVNRTIKRWLSPSAFPMAATDFRDQWLRHEELIETFDGVMDERLRSRLSVLSGD
jgi:predicted acylesterase/phospholipase RssA